MGENQSNGSNGSSGSSGSDRIPKRRSDSGTAAFSPPSHPSHAPPPVLPPRRDYRRLLSFQKAEVVYDLTFQFAHRFLSKGDRTIDQMIQAARSGKKNILEGSKAGLTSKETEIRLTNVARASLEELLDDYQDYLRVRRHPEWEKTPAKHSTYANRDAAAPRPMSSTESSWKPARRKSPPTSPSA